MAPVWTLQSNRICMARYNWMERLRNMNHWHTYCAPSRFAVVGRERRNSSCNQDIDFVISANGCIAQTVWTNVAQKQLGTPTSVRSFNVLRSLRVRRSDECIKYTINFGYDADRKTCAFRNPRQTRSDAQFPHRNGKAHVRRRISWTWSNVWIIVSSILDYILRQRSACPTHMSASNV